MLLYSVHDMSIRKTWLLNEENLEFWFTDLLKPNNPCLALKTFQEFIEDFQMNRNRIFDGAFIHQYTITEHNMSEFK